MKNILKSSEPGSLIHHRCQFNATFDNLPTSTKDELRRQLLKEQGYLCCYCMSRISESNSRIEHWHSRYRYPNEHLNYVNLLSACFGNEGSLPQNQHCDVRKGEKDILFNPAEATHYVESKIQYSGNGTVRSTDMDFDKQLNDILNLNFSRLRDNRKMVIDGVNHVLGQRSAQVTVGLLQGYIRRWKATNQDGELREYCQVALYILSKRLKRATR